MEPKTKTRNLVELAEDCFWHAENCQNSDTADALRHAALQALAEADAQNPNGRALWRPGTTLH